MYSLLLTFLGGLTGNVSSDDIFNYFLGLSYNEHQISGVIGYARKVGRLQIVGKQKSKRIGKKVNVYA